MNRNNKASEMHVDNKSDNSDEGCSPLEIEPQTNKKA